MSDAGAGAGGPRALDLRGTPCPLNYVKTKLLLEELEEGGLLEIVIDDGDPVRNVPKSIKADGHRIVKVERLGDAFKLVIEKTGV
ncbi:MAG: sulfurtransferase TusA family protein [Firmicutes bacterium]|nr:sulfurtransferase TusA family protein [Bacillota bacterium]